MRYFTCRCGKKKFLGSGEYPKECQVCSSCGTTLLKLGDGSFIEPKEHKWTTEETFSDGKLIKSFTYCKRCYETKPKDS